MNKKVLYESIMRNVAKQVKKALNEGEYAESRRLHPASREDSEEILSLVESDPSFTFQPQDNDEFEEVVLDALDRFGAHCDLNWIDTSKVTDMHKLFYESDFNGDISEWDTSNVKDMSWMFAYSKFNGDISNWDVSRVERNHMMFNGCRIREEYKPIFNNRYLNR